MSAPPGKPRAFPPRKDGSRPSARHGRSYPGGKPDHGKSDRGKPDHGLGSLPDDRFMLFGIHAVTAALANPERRIKHIVATENAENRLAEAIAERGLTTERVRPKDLDRLLGADTVHQGVAIEVEPLPEPELTQLVARANTSDGGPLIILDQVTDPHNVGAVLRSAAVFGAAGLITTRRHSPPLTGTLAKSASGALELIPVALVQNLSRALEELKAAGVTVIGLDGEGDTLLEDAPLSGAVAFVLGAEGKGLRQLTRETCSAVCRIGTSQTLASLNVSNAAAIALHLSSMRRRAGR